MSSHDPRPILAEALRLDGGEDHIELRYHAKRTRSVAVEKGRVDQAKLSEHTGVGVRVLAAGTYGFASTDRLEVGAVRAAIETARAAALASSAARKERITAPPATELAVGQFDAPGYEELLAASIEERLHSLLFLQLLGCSLLVLFEALLDNALKDFVVVEHWLTPAEGRIGAHELARVAR